jgi:hypothetical protein
VGVVLYARRVDDLLARCAAAGIPVAPATDAGIHAGLARVRRNSDIDEVDASEVTVAAASAGHASDVRRLDVPRLKRWQRPHRGGDPWRTPMPPWGMRLAKLLRAVRRAVGDVDLDVRWTDDGRVCRLIEVRAA